MVANALLIVLYTQRSLRKSLTKCSDYTCTVYNNFLHENLLLISNCKEVITPKLHFLDQKKKGMI